MAWNKPSTENQQQKQPSAKAPSVMKGLFAGLVVVVLGAICVWMFSDGGEKAASTRKERGRIKDVRPAAAREADAASRTNAASLASVSNAPSAKPMTPEEKRQWDREHPAFTNKLSRWNTSRANRIFENSVDRRLGALLDLRPGEMLVGDSELLFRPDFAKQFLKSIETPIIVTKDDSPEDAALKRAVIETKKELKDHLDAGDDIRALMIKTRKDMQNLALYRKDLENEVKKIAADRAMTEDEVNVILKKANTMLEERGAEPISMPRFVTQRFEMIRRKAAEAQGKTVPVVPHGEN